MSDLFRCAAGLMRVPAADYALLEAISIRKAGRPDDVAAMISPDAAYVTGAIWAADGGMTAV